MPDLKNYMEIVVYDVMKSIAPSLKCCMCENCQNDIMAIALNRLPNKYVVTKKGQLYTKLDTLQQQNDVDIMSALTKAAEIVAKFPRHDEEDK